MSSLPTRDDPAYWEERPSDHNALGLFREGPQPTEPPTNRLARLIRARCDVPAEGPLGAKQRMARQAERKLMLLTVVRSPSGSFVRDKSRRWRVK